MKNMALMIIRTRDLSYNQLGKKDTDVVLRILKTNDKITNLYGSFGAINQFDSSVDLKLAITHKTEQI